jgi:hypothetical protein
VLNALRDPQISTTILMRLGVTGPTISDTIPDEGPQRLRKSERSDGSG